MANEVQTLNRRRLGRGLGSLISSPVQVEIPIQSGSPGRAALMPGPVNDAIKSELSDGLQMIDVDEIHGNPRQPRQHFDEQTLRSLADSIKSSGLMQPIVVRRSPATSGFELIAGERRWRAARLAGLRRIPALIREIDDQTSAEFSLVENLQREDLNPMERARAFQRLIDEFSLTHNQIAQRVGLDRTSVTNHLRLNELDETTKQAVGDGKLSMGHAKALLALTNIERRATLADQTVREGWSVRELERQVQLQQVTGPRGEQGNSGGVRGLHGGGPGTRPLAPHLVDLEKRLGEHLGTKVHLHATPGKGAGKLIIEFYSLDQFEGLMRRMQFSSEEESG